MTMPDKNNSDGFLEEFFQAERARTPQPSGDLMARILADAEAEAALSQPVSVAVARRPGLLATLLDGIGGWPSAAGLATAAVAGFWIGFVAPDVVTGLGGQSSGAEEYGYLLSDLLPGYGDLALEEG